MTTSNFSETETTFRRGQGCGYENRYGRVIRELKELTRPAGNDQSGHRSAKYRGVQALSRGDGTQNQSLRDQVIYRGFYTHGMLS